jgi:hypothetical protein
MAEAAGNSNLKNFKMARGSHLQDGGWSLAVWALNIN